MAFENGRVSHFEGLMTLTLDWVILHTIVHHSSTSTYKPNYIKSKKLFVDGQTGGHLRPTLLGRLRRVNLIKADRQETYAYKITKRHNHRLCRNAKTNYYS